jgi:hypothetical protein
MRETFTFTLRPEMRKAIDRAAEIADTNAGAIVRHYLAAGLMAAGLYRPKIDLLKASGEETKAP